MRLRLPALLIPLAALLAHESHALAAGDLFISEYLEGSSNNKAVEIFNGTGAPVNLSGYEIRMFFNGATSPGLTVALSGTVANNDVFVLAHSSASADILAQADQTGGGGWFNGDDAVVLARGSVIVDVIGQVGVDPGTEWGTGNTSTADNTIRRKSSITAGDPVGSNAFDPALEWDGFANNTTDGLGQHTIDNPQVLINELDSDTVSTDILEFIELYDGGYGNTDLGGLVLVFFNGSDDASYRAIDLDGFQTDASGYFVVGNSAVPGVDLTFPNNILQNGADAVALYEGDATGFPSGTLVTTTNLVDAIVYDTDDADDAGLLVLLNAGQPQVNENGLGDKDNHALQRCANGSGDLRNTQTYVPAAPTPGADNACGSEPPPPPPPTGCGQPAMLIHEIQGIGASSPHSGQLHTIEGVVVGDFQGTAPGLNGFFVQEENAHADSDPQTSEGIFVFDGSFGVAVAVGDVVRVSGTVTEFDGETQLSTVTSVTVCSSGASVTPAAVSLPFSTSAFAERFEGMAVTLSQTLTITETFGLGRFGELVLSSGSRLFTPTNVVNPGPDAIALQAANDRNRIVLDDGQTVQNPDPIPYPAPGLSAQNTVRVGDTVTGLSGVLGHRFGAYRVQPTQTPSFVAANPRPVEPPLPGTGKIRVAGANVLNFFNGDGQGGGFPTSRGAHSLFEFERQRAKIVSALLGMDADVIGLMEVENDGYGSESAIQELVDALNAAGGNYAFIHPGSSALGGDEIAVGIIYRPTEVTPIGAAATLNTFPFDTRNRQPLLQTFQEVATGARFSLVVNHFKSKGSCPSNSSDPNADQGDGQGCWNPIRVEAAQALTDWLATDPTRSGDPDFLIVGDLNAYAKEDPVIAIQDAGYVNVIAQFLGEHAYSYVFSGQSGYLDHALASTSLAAQVTGVAEWHINSDEPIVLDYNVEFKTPGQVTSLYSPAAFRSSDHDPVVVELNLTVPADASDRYYLQPLIELAKTVFELLFKWAGWLGL